MNENKTPSDASSHEGINRSAESSGVSVRAPPFYPQKPALWFHQLEAQFSLANITSDERKYAYVVGNLDPQYASEIDDIIESPPAVGKYTTIKAELIKRLSASKERKVKQLLMHEELGDRKPSQFYRHLLNLAGTGVPEEFLRTIWASRLPPSTQTIIAAQPRASLEEVAELADRIQDVVNPQVAAATPAPALLAPSRSDDLMVTQIAALTRQVEALTTRVERMSRSRGKSYTRSHHRSRSRSHSNYKKHPTCWYHFKFGDKASKCTQPCDYNAAGNSQGTR